MSQYPKVSVCMITYGHEKYIRQAIEGVLMQQCDFEVEFIVANDCSPDATGQVIKDIIKSHPRGSWIKYMRHDKNLGMMPNFIFAIQECKGEYIALCEGDDYWTDPFKLQKQVDFLENNSKYSYCGHKSFVLENEIFTPVARETKEITLAVLLNKNGLNTATLVFRKSSIGIFPSFFKDIAAGDWFLQLMAIKNGDGFVLDDFMSVYRVHSGGIWSALSDKEMCKLGVDTLNQARFLFKDKKTNLLINKSISDRLRSNNLIPESFGIKFEKRIKKYIKLFCRTFFMNTL